MRIAAPARLSALALAGLAAVAVAAGTATPSAERSAAPAAGQDVRLAALPALSFPAGVYMENRVSDQVQLPPGTVLVFQGLPPGLTYDQATTAIRGVPTTPGVYQPQATAYIGGIPVRTEATTVTITGDAVIAPAPVPGAGPVPAPPAPQPVPAPAAPAPGTIDLTSIRTLGLPKPVEDALVVAATGINNGIAAAWAAVPPGSLGK